jgi:hypothetical protein
MIVPCPTCLGQIDCQPTRKLQSAICPHCDQEFHLPLRNRSTLRTVVIALIVVVSLLLIAGATWATVQVFNSSARDQLLLIAGLIALMFVAAGLYFLPTFIAFGRSHRNTLGVCIVNVAFGWTLLGWVVALVWSIHQEKPA